MPYILYEQGITAPELFLQYREPKWELDLALPFIGLKAGSIFLKIQFLLQILIMYVLPFFVLYFLVKAIFEYLKEKNVRLTDKYYNEINFSTLLLIKIKELKMGDRYQDVDYEKFLKNIAKLGYDRGLINYDWFKDFSALMQLYQATRKVVNYDIVKKNISEIFYNVLRYILDSIRAVYTGAARDFSLETIYDKYKELLQIQIDITKTKAEKRASLLSLT
jgi:hypothetical protein